MRLLRMLGIVLGMLVTIGFGVCGVFGLLAPGREGGDLARIFGLIGLGLAALFGTMVWIAIKDKPNGGQPPEQ
jgi:uncharacterized YccA/Bax inhibitor family protein